MRTLPQQPQEAALGDPSGEAAFDLGKGVVAAAAWMEDAVEGAAHPVGLAALESSHSKRCLSPSYGCVETCSRSHYSFPFVVAGAVAVAFPLAERT